jgi:phi13 family phage major tail protein
METTIAKVGYAMLTESDGKISYDKIKWFKSEEAGGREITAEPNGDTIKIYADGRPVVQAIGNDGYNITLILLDIIDDVQGDWFNKKILSNGSVLETAEIKESPRFALVVAKELFNSGA